MLSRFAMPPGRLLSSQPAFHFTRIETQLQSLLLCVMQPFHDVPSHFGRDVSEGALRETARIVRLKTKQEACQRFAGNSWLEFVS